jgi:hypothetical protein
VSGLPRQPPTVFTRTRISEWFERHSDLPLRLLTGSPGAGKTTATVSYLAGRPGAVTYLALKGDETPERFRERLAMLLGLDYAPASFEALLAALGTVAPRELAIDEIDYATPETLEELGELAAAAPAGIALIYCTRSRDAIDAGRFLPRGLAALLDGPHLAFDAGDVEGMAERLGVVFLPPDVRGLLDETEGWPIVTTWAIRDAAESGTTLAGAYERWRRKNGRHFRDFLAREMLRAGEAPALPEPRRLEMLEARGLFVYFADDAYHPYRVAQEFDLELTPSRAGYDSPPLFVARLFGRFEAEIDGKRVEWIRRRDASLVKYLLLKPNGTASRSELREVFWPHSDRHLATQSIRTSCSNIRKAIAAIVGYACVERYFSSRGDVSLNLENAVVDAHSFSAHLADGDAEAERGRKQDAFAHYGAAELLYSGDLFGGDYPEPWHARYAEPYRELRLGLLERIAAYHRDCGRLRQGRSYAKRASELRTAPPAGYESRLTRA